MHRPNQGSYYDEAWAKYQGGTAGPFAYSSSNQADTATRPSHKSTGLGWASSPAQEVSALADQMKSDLTLARSPPATYIQVDDVSDEAFELRELRGRLRADHAKVLKPAKMRRQLKHPLKHPPLKGHHKHTPSSTSGSRKASAGRHAPSRAQSPVRSTDTSATGSSEGQDLAIDLDWRDGLGRGDARKAALAQRLTGWTITLLLKQFNDKLAVGLHQHGENSETQSRSHDRMEGQAFFRSLDHPVTPVRKRGQEAVNTMDSVARISNQQKKTRTKENETKLFACPFFKRNPHRYKRCRSCPGPGWVSVHRLK